MPTLFGQPERPVKVLIDRRSGKLLPMEEDRDKQGCICS